MAQVLGEKGFISMSLGCWERLKAVGEGDGRGWDGWMASLTWWPWVWASFGSWWWTESWCAAVHRVAESWTPLSDWTELRMRVAERRGMKGISVNKLVRERHDYFSIWADFLYAPFLLPQESQSLACLLFFTLSPLKSDRSPPFPLRLELKRA